MDEEKSILMFANSKTFGCFEVSRIGLNLQKMKIITILFIIYNLKVK